MGLWSNRKTEMEHAKTRAIEVKANGKDHDESENEKDDIDIIAELRQDLERMKNEVNHCYAVIKQNDIEINRLRILSDKNTEFMQDIILELIRKPGPPSAAALYAASKSPAASAPASSLSGPKGKLP